MKLLPPDSVRGRIRGFIERNVDLLGENVLEVGSRMTDANAWWIVNRDLAKGAWTGIDMQPGHGVDLVADIHALPAEWTGRFSSVLCSEVLEHVAKPWVALPELRRVIRPGGSIIVTTLFAFPEHGFPDDYFRYSRSGLQNLLSDAGFKEIYTEYAGSIQLVLNDHGESVGSKLKLPIHVFATAKAQ